MAFQYQKSDDVRRKDELSDDLFTKYLDKSQSDFSSPYTEKKNKAMTDIENIGDFKYDFADDPMYAAIRDNYARQGKLAMQDAVGKASAATGGYGNSYAASAGAQAYNQYIAQTSEMIPELYQMAYALHADKKNDAYKKASLYDSLEATDYSRRLDDISRAYNDYGAAASRADTAYNRDFNEKSTEYQTGYQEAADERNYRLSASSNALAWQKYNDEKAAADAAASAKAVYEMLSEDKLDAIDKKIKAVRNASEEGTATDGDVANVWQYMLNVGGQNADPEVLAQYFENQFPDYKIDKDLQLRKSSKRDNAVDIVRFMKGLVE